MASDDRHRVRSVVSSVVSVGGKPVGEEGKAVGEGRRGEEVNERSKRGRREEDDEEEESPRKRRHEADDDGDQNRPRKSYVRIYPSVPPRPPNNPCLPRLSLAP